MQARGDEPGATQLIVSGAIVDGEVLGQPRDSGLRRRVRVEARQRGRCAATAEGDDRPVAGAQSREAMVDGKQRAERR